MTIQHHNSNMYHSALNKVMNTGNLININDKINLKTQSKIGMNGVLRFYSIGMFRKNNRSLLMNT